MHYWPEAIWRSLITAREWANANGVEFAVVTVVCAVLLRLTAMAIMPRLRQWAAISSIERAFSWFVIPGFGGLLAAGVFIFLAQLLCDPPRQLAIAHNKIAELESALKEKVADLISVEFENKRHWILPPEDRPKYRNWAVRIGVTVKTVLKRPRAYLLSVSNPAWTLPIEVKAPLAWYAFDRAYDLDTIEIHDYLVPFVGSASGKRLYLLTNNKAHELDPLTNMKPGAYKFRIIIEAENIPTPEWKQYILTVRWSGDMKDFNMEVTPTQ